MNPQHLSDEAVAAFADGVLRGAARDRATRHLDGCAECRHAVTVQREAAMTLRAAAAPALPSSLLDRLRDVPQTTPLTTLPTALAPDGSTVLSTFAPMAALVPGSATESRSRMRPIVTGAALVGVAGALVAGAVAGALSSGDAPDRGSTPQVRTVNQHRPADPQPAGVPAGVFRGPRP